MIRFLPAVRLGLPIVCMLSIGFTGAIAGDLRLAAPSISYDVGTQPESAAIGDINADGSPDILITNRYGDVTVLLGEGDGYFRSGGSLPSGQEPWAAVLVDLNGDALVDAAVANASSGVVSVFLGHGDGTFDVRTDYACGSGPRSLIAADLDGDGVRDLITANFLAGSVSVLTGRGDGTFPSRADYPAGRGAHSVAAGDLNGDQVKDLVVADYDASSLSIFFGRPDGTLLPEIRLPAEADPMALALGDLNEDGKLDIVVPNRYLGTVGIFLNDGSGGFQPRVGYAAGAGAKAALILDVDQDGHADLLTANYDGDTVSFFRGVGDGTLEDRIDTWVGSGPHFLAAADLNGDSHADLAVPDYSSNSATILLGNGDGTFGTPSLPAGSDAIGVALGFLDDNPFLDAVVANRAGKTISVLMDVREESVGSRREYPVNGEPSDVVLNDMDGDGALDLISTVSSTGEISIRWGLGNGLFSEQDALVSGGYNPTSVVIGDLDENGYPDLVVTNSGFFDRYGGASGGNAAILFGLGQRQFTPRSILYSALTTGTTVLADLNSDSHLDVVVSDPFGKCVSFLGRGDGSFDSQVDYPLDSPNVMAPADVNGDSIVDIVVTYAGGIGLLPGRGDGTFGTLSNLAGEPWSRRVMLADLDADRLPDLVTGGLPTRAVKVRGGAGAGTFRPGTSWGTGGAEDVAIGDLDLDGRLDLLVANRGAGSVTPLLNLSADPLRADVEDWRAERRDRSVILSWAWREILPAEYRVRVWREEDGTWTHVADMPGSAGGAVDSNVSDLALRYWFEVSDRAGRRLLRGPFTVPAVDPASRVVAKLPYPNPFHGSASLNVDLLHGTRLAISVVDVQGRYIAEIVSGDIPAGPHVFTWDGRNQEGVIAPSGVYFLIVRSRFATLTYRLVRLQSERF